MKISKYFKYLKTYTGNQTFSFGWKEVKKFSTSNEKCVVSINLNDHKDISIATLSDYSEFSESLTGFSPKEFVSIWEDDISILEDYQKDQIADYKDGQGKFIFDLNKLILDGDSFVYRNIKYKII